MKIQVVLAVTSLLLLYNKRVNGTTEKASPLLWRKSPIPITTGFDQMNLLVSFLNPCEVISNASVHVDLSPQARKQCDEMYEESFLNELEKICPRKKWTEMAPKRQKRFVLIALAVTSIISVVSAGLGVAGVVYASQHSSRISSLENARKEEAKRLERLEQEVRLNANNINILQQDVQNTINTLNHLQDDHGELKGKLIATNYAISYVTSRIMIGRAILKETYRNWREGKVTGAFLDYLNITLPCKDDCPILYAQPQSCRMSEDRTKMYMDFFSPIVSKNLVLVEADPFRLMLKKGNQTCTVEYTGPTNAVLAQQENCIYGVSVKNPATHDLIVSPTRGCKAQASFSKTGRYYGITHCENTQAQDEIDFIQLKPHHGQYYIYCPGSNFTIEGRVEICPEDVFTLPLSASFKINEMEFLGSRVNLVHHETLDPMFTLRTNWHLQPSLNMTMLADTVLDHPTYQQSLQHEGLQYTVIGCFSAIAVLLLFITVSIFFRRRIVVTPTALAESAKF